MYLQEITELHEYLSALRYLPRDYIVIIVSKHTTGAYLTSKIAMLLFELGCKKNISWKH